MDKVIHWCTLVDNLYQVAERSPLYFNDAGPPAAWLTFLQQVAEFLQVERIVLAQPEKRSVYNALSCVSAGRTIRIAGDDVGKPAQVEVVVIGLSGRDFTQSQRQQIYQFASQLFLCLQLQNQMLQTQREVDTLYTTLNQLPLAVVLSTTSLKPLFVNQACKDLTASHSGFSIDSTSIRYLTRQGDVLQYYLHGNKSSAVHRLPRYSQFVIDSLLFSATFNEMGLILFVEQLGQPASAQEVGNIPVALEQCLQQSFMLSKKEIQLTYALAMGLNLRQYSELCHRSLLTVRSQLKSVLQKTEMNDQRSLVLLVQTVRAIALFRAVPCGYQQQGIHRWVYPPMLESAL